MNPPAAVSIGLALAFALSMTAEARVSRAAQPASDTVVDARSLLAVVEPDPWRLSFIDASSALVLREAGARGADGLGGLGFLAGSRWVQASRILEQRWQGKTLIEAIRIARRSGRAGARADRR